MPNRLLFDLLTVKYFSNRSVALKGPQKHVRKKNLLEPSQGQNSGLLISRQMLNRKKTKNKHGSELHSDDIISHASGLI